MVNGQFVRLNYIQMHRNHWTIVQQCFVGSFIHPVESVRRFKTRAKKEKTRERERELNHNTVVEVLQTRGGQKFIIAAIKLEASVRYCNNHIVGNKNRRLISSCTQQNHVSYSLKFARSFLEREASQSHRLHVRFINTASLKTGRDRRHLRTIQHLMLSLFIASLFAKVFGTVNCSMFWQSNATIKVKQSQIAINCEL